MTHRDDLLRIYQTAAHAVQAGVAMDLADDSRQGNTNSSASPKQLRTGLNMAMVGHGALLRLLIKKGLITELEYLEELVSGALDEQLAYEAKLSARHGAEIHLV